MSPSATKAGDQDGAPWRPWLDPRCDYIVFETRPGPEGTSAWETIQNALAAHRHGIVAQTVRRGASRQQLALKLAPESAEAIKSAVLDMKLAEDVVVFVYHRSRAPSPG